MSQPMRIEPGRVTVVTGGASGIGYALAAVAARIAFSAVADRRPLAFTHPDRIPEVEQRFAAIIAGARPRE